MLSCTSNRLVPLVACPTVRAASCAAPSPPNPLRPFPLPPRGRHLRGLFGIDNSQYILSICGDQALREMASPGKSGRCAGPARRPPLPSLGPFAAVQSPDTPGLHPE